jgi:hypothetical protein
MQKHASNGDPEGNDNNDDDDDVDNDDNDDASRKDVDAESDRSDSLTGKDDPEASLPASGVDLKSRDAAVTHATLLSVACGGRRAPKLSSLRATSNGTFSKPLVMNRCLSNRKLQIFYLQVCVTQTF